MSRKLALVAIALLSALFGGGAIVLFQNLRATQERSEIAAVNLSNHYGVIRQLEQGNIPAAMKYLATLADGDVVDLIEIKNVSIRPGRSEFERKLLTAYASFRKRNPDLYNVPGYVDSAGRAEYERNLARIQQFLEDRSTGQAGN